jgi:hypothetical protein
LLRRFSHVWVPPPRDSLLGIPRGGIERSV